MEGIIEVEDDRIEVDQAAPSTNCMISRFVRKSKEEVEAYRLFLVRRTLLEMLKDRGYTVSDQEMGYEFEEFRSAVGNPPAFPSLNIICFKKSGDSYQKMLVVFFGGDSLKKKDADEYSKQCESEGASAMIIVYPGSATPSARKVSKEHPKFKIQCFQMEELLTNITHHVLMPKHEILSPEDKQKLLAQYNIDEKQMPRMLQNDAVAKYYGLEAGHIVKVTHTGEATEGHVTYRCVTS